LVQLQPFNAEFYFYLGEAYAKYGETDKAIRTYEKCKTLLNDKESKKEVEKIIEQLNNI
jgi:DNA-binding SARP family transcriptional activator